ncbi:hypothetical protein CMUS01_05571 [Colletotrichum musicola]|uniref:CHAT domain-containing protein n=1 Tax=Colletotrichum musicola TaxID=2175873 RepID=A0A8H6KS72_9PEZI|nr:hypothetical protein CMUS01_05571 [Colletotrichum musicola]
MTSPSQAAFSPVTRNSSIEELQKCVGRIDSFLETIEDRHQDRAAILCDKCIVWVWIHEKSEDPKDAAEAVQSGRAAYQALLPNSVHRGRVLTNLGSSLSEHFRYSNRVEDIDEAMEISKQALSCHEPGSSAWKLVNTNIYRIAYQKGAHNRTEQTLDDAIRFLEGAESPDSVLNSDESARLGSLSTLLGHRFEVTGSLEHLERSIKAGYRAIETLKEGELGESSYGCARSALTGHYMATGHLNSLEEALRISNLLVSELNDPRYMNETRASALSCHGLILELQAKRYREADPEFAKEAIERAVDVGQAVLSILSPHAENRPLMLSMISAWFGTMAKMSQDPKWTDEGIELLQQALKSNTGHSIDDATLLANLCHLWEVKYTLTRNAAPGGDHIGILDKAIDFGKMAVSSTKVEDRHMGERCKNVGLMLLAKYQEVKDKELFPYIKEMLARAAEAETATLPIRIPSALQLGLLQYKTGDLEGSQESLQSGIRLLTSSNIQAASAEDLQQILREMPGLGSLAASVSLALRRPPFEALHSMESANCVTAGLAMTSKTDTSELQGRYPDVAEAYDDVRKRLTQVTRKLKGTGDYQSSSTLQQTLIEEMAQREDEIRQLQGFEQFQLPLDAEQATKLARDGPIIAINVSTVRSDAVIVTEDGIRSLHLPDMTYKALQARVSVFNRLGNTARRNGVSIGASKKPAGISTKDALRWLWDVAVRPILDVTPLTASRRLWWITSGSAGRAPFHAAGNYDGGPDENAINRVKSSYISSLKALKYGRERRRSTTARQGMLLVTMPTNPFPHHPLNTAFEEEAIQAAFGEDKLLHLAHPDPETVLEKISDFSFVHFACHGSSIDSNPNNSGLLLVKDGRSTNLTIADLEAVELREGSVAYLSACSTAEQTDGKLAGEAIHLANSFQALGFQHVIGTMWGANDAAAGEIAKRFYAKLGFLAGLNETEVEGRFDVATALHEAVKEYSLTCQGPDGVLKWGPFIHVGV